MRAALSLLFIALLLPQPPALPHGFIVHGCKWTVIEVAAVKDDPSREADTDCGLHLVRIRKDVAAGRDAAVTLLHEIMHALDDCHDDRWNNSNDDSDGFEGHAGVYWASEELLRFIRENPEVIRYLEIK